MPASVASSDNERDELMEDVDDAHQDNEGDLNDEDDNEMDMDDEEDAIDDDDDEDQPTQPQSRNMRPDISHNTSEDTLSFPNGNPTSNPDEASLSEDQRKEEYRKRLYNVLHPIVRKAAVEAHSYDIVPTIAIPCATSINAVTASPDFRYFFTGGSDGYIRKFAGPATVNGKSLLTVAQKHPYVESVTKAGVLQTYWENLEKTARFGSEEPEASIVYSLAVARDSLWLMSGQHTGNIRMQTVRHGCGEAITFLEKHTSAVSVLTLSTDEKSMLSGSWDKSVVDWDLMTMKPSRTYQAPGQIAAIQTRPQSSLSVPQEPDEIPLPSQTISDNNADKPVIKDNSDLADSRASTSGAGDTSKFTPNGEADSLFGDTETDSLFGPDDEAAPSAGNFGAEDDEDEFSKAVNAPIDVQEVQDVMDVQVDASLVGTPGPPKIEGTLANEPHDLSAIISSGTVDTKPEDASSPNTTTSPSAVKNGVVFESITSTPIVGPIAQDPGATSGSTFLTASHEGSLMIWDRRQQKPVARIQSRAGGPWCMDACWSTDGNSFFAGRRNNTVEEYSIHKSFKEPSRILKFPTGSGPVTAVKAMPNGRHLICASYDILRLYDLQNPAAGLPTAVTKGMGIPFTIVPGPPKPGVISSLFVDPLCKYMLSAAGNRGWEGSTTESLVGYEIACLP